MNKGVLASVAALAMSAGAAFGQGGPPAAVPQGYPTWGGAGPAPAIPTASSSGAPMMLPQATEMPHNGVVGDGPGGGFEPTWGGDGAGPYGGQGQPQQVHKAAGGPDKAWIDVALWAYRVRSMPIAFPLAVVSPPAAGGILGQPGSRVVFGDDNIDYGDHLNALRLSGGFWCGCDRKWGIELAGFVQEARSELGNFSAPIGGNQVLSRPLIDALTGQPSAVIVGFPGQFGGEMFINSRLKLGGAEANVVRSIAYFDKFKLNLIGGVRYIDHDETLQITSRSTIPALDPTDPTIVDIFDEFAARNQFFGGQAGFEVEYRCDRLFTDFTAKIAVGNQNEHLQTSGFTNTQVTGVTTTVPAGMLVLAGNTVDMSKNQFAYVPEFAGNIGWQWTQRISTYIGYDILYISRLLRPGEQIDPVINPSFLPVSQQFGANFGPVRPLIPFKRSDFWAQGFTFGVSIRY